MTAHGTVSYAACVASELRAEAAKQRISGRVLAHHVNRPVTTVSRWLNGTTPLSLDDMHLLCESLRVSPAVINQRAQDTYDGAQITPGVAGPVNVEGVPFITKR